jgi:hypothetical protein
VYSEKPDEFNRVLDGFLAEVDKGVPGAAR